MVRSSPFRLGRRPDVELPLDPERDLSVSALHAELVLEDGRWLVRDLGSRNGTLVNGHPVHGPTPLTGGDRIGLGPDGPILEFQHGAAGVPAGSPTTHLRARLGRERRALGGAAAGLALLLLVVVAGFLFTSRRERAGWDEERARLEARADSALRSGDVTVAHLEGELDELAAVLRSSREELRSARDALGEAVTGSEADPDEIEALHRRLLSATAALERQQLAASLDFDAIQAANRRAVALLFVERPDGTVTTGTAFAVDAKGILLTSRHVVLGEGGDTRPSRIAVQFADSRQVWQARLIAASTEWDLAAVRVEGIVGDVPTVRGLNLQPDTLVAGTPVASLGFPLGGDTAAPGETRALARPLPSAGILTGTGLRPLEFQGYGEPGASGSPVFGGDGIVVGILFGGRREDGARIVVAVPSDVAVTLLEAVAAGGQ